jgi:ABC-type polysaccharide/polyol phosphate export permease
MFGPPPAKISLDMTPQYAAVVSDFTKGLRSWRLWGRSGWQEVRRRYRRTALGPFWSTASLAIFVVTLGYVWSHLWHQNPRTYLPYLTSGMITWVMISVMISEGCTVFVAGEALIKQMPFSYSVLVLSMIWRNLIVFLHNLLIYAIIVLWSGTSVGAATLLALPGLFVICINAAWMAILVGLLCTRFRDISQIITSVLQIVLFVTPVFYPKQSLGAEMEIFTRFNVINHLIDIVRAPLLNEAPELWSWEFTLLFAAVGWTLTFFVYALFRRRIAYWL